MLLGQNPDGTSKTVTGSFEFKDRGAILLPTRSLGEKPSGSPGSGVSRVGPSDPTLKPDLGEPLPVATGTDSTASLSSPIPPPRTWREFFFYVIQSESWQPTLRLVVVSTAPVLSIALLVAVIQLNPGLLASVFAVASLVMSGVAMVRRWRSNRAGFQAPESGMTTGMGPPRRREEPPQERVAD